MEEVKGVKVPPLMELLCEEFLERLSYKLSSSKKA